MSKYIVVVEYSNTCDTIIEQIPVGGIKLIKDL